MVGSVGARRPIIHVESPLAPQRGDPGWPNDQFEGTPAYRKAAFQANVDFAEKVCRQIAHAGGIPLAPHIYFIRFLNDFDQRERALGLGMGVERQALADEVWFTLPSWRLGFSSGMNDGLNRATALGIPIVTSNFEANLVRLRRGEVKLRYAIVPHVP